MTTTKRRDPELALARRFKRAGGHKATYVQTRSEAMRKSAASQGWSPVELALTLADVQQIADKVWP